jgi:hypothetical protein
MTVIESTGRRSWLIVLPTLLLALIAAAWTGLWFYAAHTAEQTIEAWMAREAALGRVYRCGSREVGGYPFRFEVRCTDPSAEIAAEPAPLVLKAGALVAVAQIYQPSLVIAELTGPLTFAELGRPPVVSANWTLAQASLRGTPGDPERVSVAVDALKLDRLDGTQTQPLGGAKHVEMHGRRDPNGSATEPLFDFAMRADGATVAAVRGLLAQPFAVEIETVLSGVRDLTPKSVPARLREWQANGGKLTINKARFDQGTLVAQAAGDLQLSPNGRLDGLLRVTMAGIERLGPALSALGGQSGALQAGVLAGLAFLGKPAELDGKRAVEVPLRFADGAITFGPIPVGQTPPLF